MVLNTNMDFLVLTSLGFAATKDQRPNLVRGFILSPICFISQKLVPVVKQCILHRRRHSFLLITSNSKDICAQVPAPHFEGGVNSNVHYFYWRAFQDHTMHMFVQIMCTNLLLKLDPLALLI